MRSIYGRNVTALTNASMAKGSAGTDVVNLHAPGGLAIIRVDNIDRAVAFSSAAEQSILFLFLWSFEVCRRGGDKKRAKHCQIHKA